MSRQHFDQTQTAFLLFTPLFEQGLREQIGAYIGQEAEAAA